MAAAAALRELTAKAGNDRLANIDPPCGEAMGRWQREALTEGLWRYRCRPSTTRCASGPPPHRCATGRIVKGGFPPQSSQSRAIQSRSACTTVSDARSADKIRIT